jgi:DNA repair exonuclease SbcCD nuclease subunit
MALFMTIGDVHLRDTNPSMYKGSYIDDLFSLLEECVKLAREYKCSAVIQAGDLVDIKNPSRTSHATVQRTIETLKSFPCPVFVVPGNHDIQNDRLASIYETQPLGVIYRSGAAIDLRGWAEDYPIYGVPWQQSWEDEVVEEALADFQEPYKGAVRNPSKCLVVTHAPLFPPGLEPPYEYYYASSWASAMGNKGSVYYGHIHESHGIYEVDGVTFANHGALSRGSLDEQNLTREIAVTLWDSKTGKFERLPVPHKPASEVFKVEQKKEIKDLQQKLDQFLLSVNQSTIEITSVEAVIKHINSMDLDKKIIKAIEELLQEANSGMAST